MTDEELDEPPNPQDSDPLKTDRQGRAHGRASTHELETDVRPDLAPTPEVGELRGLEAKPPARHRTDLLQALPQPETAGSGKCETGIARQTPRLMEERLFFLGRALAAQEAGPGISRSRIAVVADPEVRSAVCGQRDPLAMDQTVVRDGRERQRRRGKDQHRRHEHRPAPPPSSGP